MFIFFLVVLNFVEPLSSTETLSSFIKIYQFVSEHQHFTYIHTWYKKPLKLTYWDIVSPISSCVKVNFSNIICKKKKPSNLSKTLIYVSKFILNYNLSIQQIERIFRWKRENFAYIHINDITEEKKRINMP